MELDPLLAENRDNWDSRVPVHLGPNGYRQERYVDDPTWVSEMVRFDQPLLGDLTGLSVVHLQCHIGTDTVSLARVGPSEVVGVDFSEPAIEAARDLAARTGANVTFVVSDVYNAAVTVGREFDVLYTSVGAIGWFPDLARWAANVAGLLRPGGRFVFRDLHPAAWPYEAVDGQVVPHYWYWKRDEPLVEDEETSYLGDGKVTSPRANEWSHPVSEVLNAIIGAGLRLDRVEEHEGCDWPMFGELSPQEGDQWFFPDHLRDKVPMMWSIAATKPE